MECREKIAPPSQIVKSSSTLLTHARGSGMLRPRWYFRNAFRVSGFSRIAPREGTASPDFDLADQLRERLGILLDVDASSIADESRFADLGVDSMMRLGLVAIGGAHGGPR